ncbi:MAG: hypothetical protein HYV63_25550 [Candidatus Schekmanbacteria bacterium]|nr:hypothetical protein [Candidatus Schekmanbacteria bacterium]
MKWISSNNRKFAIIAVVVSAAIAVIGSLHLSGLSGQGVGRRSLMTVQRQPDTGAAAASSTGPVVAAAPGGPAARTAPAGGSVRWVVLPDCTRMTISDNMVGRLFVTLADGSRVRLTKELLANPPANCAR